MNALSLLQAGELQRQLDILQRGQHWNQVELLEDEADVLVAPSAPICRSLKLVHVVPEDPNVAAGRPVHRRDDVRQGGLARPDPHQRNKLSLMNFQLHPVQRVVLQGFLWGKDARAAS
jgi:hypothetical protein